MLATALIAFPLDRTFALDLDAGGAAVPLVPLVMLAAAAAAWWTRARALAGVGVAVALSALLVIGPVQVFLAPDGPAAAGRLDRLRRAVADAKRAAGPGGWVAIDPGAKLEAAVAARLRDGVGAGHRMGRLPRHGGSDSLEGLLPELPLAELPDGLPVGVLTRFRPVVLPVGTGGGQGIFVQTPFARRGPWLVLRLTRP